MPIPKDKTSRIILAGFAIIIFCVMASLVWLNRSSQYRESEIAQVVFQRRVDLTAVRLRACFDEFASDGLALNGKWRRNSNDPNRIQSSNFARHLTVSITDDSTARLVEVETRSGHPLRLGEQKQIEKCVGAGTVSIGNH